MAIELKQTVKLSQQLMITPQLQQAIKLLQLSRAELVETVQKELLENPVLEENEDRSKQEQPLEDSSPNLNTSSSNDQLQQNEKNLEKEFDWSKYVESYQSRGSESKGFREVGDQPNYENMLSNGTSLQDHLEWQIQMGSYLSEEKEVCEMLVGNVDDNGYLQSTLEELENKTEYNMDQLEDGLSLLQEMDPPGVGARNLQECLLLQIKDTGDNKAFLKNIISNHLNLIEKRDYKSLAKKISTNMQKAKDLAEIIFSLEPKPGRIFSGDEAQYVTPDVYVKHVGGEYTVILNEDGLPKLQISNLYKSAIQNNLEKKEDKEEKTESKSSMDDTAKEYIQDKLKSALWLIKSIHQRQKTMYKVTKSIVKFQREFFDKGVVHLKPLVLKDVADEIGVHESTVSRATSGKYVHTPQGIFELKYFFNTGLSNKSGGQDFANEAVKQIIKKIVDAEDIKSPLSDQAIAKLLAQQNIKIARRTVAKYREMLGILPSSKRKRVS